MARRMTGAVALALAALGTTAHGRPITPDDIARLMRVSDPQVAPDGQWVAYTVAGTDVAADKGYSHIWMTSWDGLRAIQLTNRHGESETTPRFSPDGHWLAFVSGRGSEGGEAQLWIMDRAGGEGRKADQGVSHTGAHCLACASQKARRSWPARGRAEGASSNTMWTGRAASNADQAGRPAPLGSPVLAKLTQ